ncbi:hypothetical protein FRC09_006384 [Ceratobasidium sp. 395]|nr:hypothetical protein FRC09_006384 [Ceratobasidium sp. 395]
MYNSFKYKSCASKLHDISADLARWYDEFLLPFDVYPDEVGMTDQLVARLYADVWEERPERLKARLAKRNEERKGGHDFVLEFQIDPDKNQNYHTVVLYIQAKNLQEDDVEFM